MADLSSIVKLLEKLIEIERLIEIKIGQVKDVKKRKKISEAIKARDRDTLNQLLFD